MTYFTLLAMGNEEWTGKVHRCIERFEKIVWGRVRKTGDYPFDAPDRLDRLLKLLRLVKPPLKGYPRKYKWLKYNQYYPCTFNSCEEFVNYIKAVRFMVRRVTEKVLKKEMSIWGHKMQGTIELRLDRVLHHSSEQIVD